MGWKGTLRAIAAAQRRMERESKRRQRELERERKQVERIQELEQAAYDVQVFENYIEVLTSVHKDCGEEWDWAEISATAPPEKPVRQDVFQEEALNRLEAYRPSVMDRVLQRAEGKRRKLVKAVEAGKSKDEDLYLKALKEYERNYADWEATHSLAVRILSGDREAYVEAISRINPFREISELGSSVEFHAVDSKVLEATIYVNGEEVVPTEAKALLRSGKLSVKKMPKTKFYELYQDYVCGAVLRVSRESFALLPIQMVIVTAVSEILNSKTGYLENRPILSVAIPRKTLERLNFAALDPSDAMDNFLHRMKFQKTKGFLPVERILPSEIEPL
ncbi:hypothetical protein Ocepr_1923 [Oceanithermus profundus DSM 14977]|uniref:Uncharacterized protein n=2 Tax=Oceanithermus profundus TaxID=187137 RepID=E4U9Z8_OCEP5|nr:hypothetical protein Ocepr_1923 [Oceanithermus profundus DSM 14977]